MFIPNSSRERKKGSYLTNDVVLEKFAKIAAPLHLSFTFH